MDEGKHRLTDHQLSLVLSNAAGHHTGAVPDEPLDCRCAGAAALGYGDFYERMTDAESDVAIAVSETVASRSASSSRRSVPGIARLYASPDLMLRRLDGTPLGFGARSGGR